MTNPLPQRPAGGSRGVALIVTLMMMSVLVMMVVGLAGVMRNEQAAARNLTYQVLADQLAEIGARQAMGVVLSNSLLPGNLASPMATGPGWMLAGGQTLPLFTQRAADFGAKNLEEIGTNSLILSLPTAGRGLLQAAWTNLSAGGGEPAFGRYAWWVDDEGGKINLNFVGGTNQRVFSRITNLPLAAKYFSALASGNFLFVSNFISGEQAGADATRADALARRTNPFFTAESLKDTNVTGLTTANNSIGSGVYRRTKGQVTAWASNANLNPWGQPKVSLTNFGSASNITNAVAFGNLLNQTFAHPALASNFSANLVLKYGGGNSNLGFMVIRQTLANAYEALQPATATNLIPPLSGATGTNVPTDFLAVSPRGVLLNEVAVAVSIARNPNPTVNTLQIQVWIVPELVTGGPNLDIPFENTVTSFEMPNFGIRVVSATAGGQTIGSITNFYARTIVTNSPARRTGTIATNSFYTNRTWACYEYTWGPGRGIGPANFLNNAGNTTALTLDVDIPRITVYQNFGGLVAMDWFQENRTVRFSFPGNIADNGGATVPNPSFSASMQTAVNLPTVLGANSFEGSSKTDPRVRSFSAWSNAAVVWTNLAATPGVENTNIPIASNRLSLPRDLLPATISALREGKIWSLPTNNNWINSISNSPAWMVQRTNFPAVAALGYIHTGLPWRTLKFSAQGDEPNPPDWILTDLMTASPSGTTAGPAINLNNQIWSLSNNGTRWLAAGTTNRVPTVLSLLASLSSATMNGAFTNRWAATNFGRAWTNLNNTTDSNRWVANSFWSRFRQTTIYTNPGIFLFGGELAEISGVGNVGTTDEEREAALMAAGDLVVARSDTFTVWSAGQGLQLVTNSAGQVLRTNIMAEVRKQTVFQRLPGTNTNGTYLTNAAGTVTNWTLRVLYTRNHVVE